jgi:hypothetical protein
MRTLPVKFSGEPCIDGCEPFRLISTGSPYAVHQPDRFSIHARLFSAGVSFD